MIAKGLLAATVVLSALQSPANTAVNREAGTQGHELWVNARSTASLETGTRAAPFRTIEQALAKAPAGCVVWVAGGEYTEHVSLRDGVTLRGDGDTRPVLRGPDRNRPTLSMDGQCAAQFLHLTGGGHGIFARLGSDVRILDCEIVDTRGDGIFFEKHLGGANPRTRIHIEGCLIRGNRDGIDVEGNQGVVTRSRLIGNTDDGLDYDGDTDFAAIENEIRDNFDDGIEIRLRVRTLARLERNVITGNGEDGIEVINTPETGRSANRVTMTGNTVRANRRYGIAAVNHGTEDVKPGLEVLGLALKDNSIEGNLKEQVVGVTEPGRGAAATPTTSEAELVVAPHVVTEKPVWIAYLSGPGGSIGRAELQHNIRDGKVIKRKFRLTVRNGPPGTTWDIGVDGVVVGQITLGDGGGMDLDWATKRGSFPAGFPEGAGRGSVVALGRAMSGTLREASDATDAEYAARWREVEAATSSSAAKLDEASIQRLAYVAYLSGSSGSGKAELYYKIANGKTIKKQLQITVTGGTPGATWDVSVDGTVIGRITLGSGGGMQMEWSTKYGSFPANFPAGAGAGSAIALGDALSGRLESRTGGTIMDVEAPTPSQE